MQSHQAERRRQCLHVRLWHLTDISERLGACPLSWVKRTCRGRDAMSAFDPLRTFDRDGGCPRGMPPIFRMLAAQRRLTLYLRFP